MTLAVGRRGRAITSELLQMRVQERWIQVPIQVCPLSNVWKLFPSIFHFLSSIGGQGSQG